MQRLFPADHNTDLEKADWVCEEIFNIVPICNGALEILQPPSLNDETVPVRHKEDNG